jgi:sulfatase maturation enzyme AslB (radical SAM superfamily)
MDLPVITPTLISPRVLHIEPTDVCNAACPACARETDTNFNKNVHHHLTVEQIKSKFSPEFIRNLDKMFMCGNYGDPAAGLHTLDIFKYFRSVNPAITLGMNTNGGLKSTHWWQELASILSGPQDYVVFSIDGLSNTNHIYRVNVDWDKLMSNALTFIKNQGSAHWDMLVFKHNEHQVTDCERLAKDLGFTWFRAKVSKRECLGATEKPVHWQRPEATGPIECQALKEGSQFISAQGRVSACCWLGEVDPIADFGSVQASWNTANPHWMCNKVCSTSNNQSNFTSQWQHVVQF